MNLEIRQSKFSDCNELLKTIRAADALECQKQGFEPGFGLRYSYKNALYRMTAEVNGKVSAMWGVCGSLLSDKGYPYLVTGENVLLVPHIRFVKIYRHEIVEMHKLFPLLENFVDADYDQSVRLLKLSGFTVEEPRAGLRKFWKEAS